MKLDKLWISEFKNLKDIEIDFDQNELVTVIIGWNGAGKSNVIEALVIIFRDLDLYSSKNKFSPEFSYKLEYICRGNRIIVEAKKTEVKKEQYKVIVHFEGDPQNIVTENINEFFDNEEREYLPSNVFGYYSGPSDRLATHFYNHQRKFRDQLLYPKKHGLNEKTLPLRPLFYAQKVHSNFVLLAFFLGADKKVINFLKKKLFIDDLESVLFILKKPSWPGRDTGDKRFWKADGIVKPFLNRLMDACLAPMEKTIEIPHPMKPKPEKVHAKFLFLKDINALKDSGKDEDGKLLPDKDYFKLLESIYFSDLIHEVRIRVKIRDKNGTDESLTFRELSEGEQQLITVLGLLRFTRDDESLFLLDEPDTHLNPAWSMEYISFLKEVAGFNLDVKGKPNSDAVDNSHIVLATHDPVVISGLEKSQIQIMKRNEDTLKVFAEPPSISPKGLGVSGILTSEMFGLRSDLDVETLKLVDRHVELLGKEPLTKSDAFEIQRITQELDGLGLMQPYGDPYYSAFIKAWSRINKDKSNGELLTQGDYKRGFEEGLASNILKLIGQQK
ncbi:AAA family ATPase [Pseudoalteromonas distincta]|uniref:AAA family ATPase n=1 Tax=Pseudoalteromonas distincta TaxID=77608 RepID=UPI0011952102|nr:AAA family ATPase [Pseudoalteromonas elyakovii]TVU72441.1 AAA family ATPase [Pseudoalteromonas elyakovii]